MAEFNLYTRISTTLRFICFSTDHMSSADIDTEVKVQGLMVRRQGTRFMRDCCFPRNHLPIPRFHERQCFGPGLNIRGYVTEQLTTPGPNEGVMEAWYYELWLAGGCVPRQGSRYGGEVC